ncbi:Alpha/Beta hydrolase protein [Lineolata rhizophorae]|uniref:Carboxylic ester hydrolase n=1 Tax=Lineolata rhizophorae TaxID=578093 RepID=A0A6A6P3T0_9PEZI|nr:Alpha/Beta hydrolase protein [Lineolata rhizophorae]
MTTQEPYTLDLAGRGFIQGLTFADEATGAPIAHRFGGLPYAQPLAGRPRWRRARPLDDAFVYGTRERPGSFAGQCTVCPQPSFDGSSVTHGCEENEDCLQVNVWVPAGAEPGDGWPVFVYIHGGFLQMGDANGLNPLHLYAETDCKFVLVEPAYRLNVLGFLASKELQEEAKTDGDETVGNLGFWDQRLALEWTRDNIELFGGDPDNITVGGYSAGSHSTFYQLQYDLFQPDENSLIRRAIMWSNGPGVQPKSMREAQAQFDWLLKAADIPPTISSESKLARLRAMDPATLILASTSTPLHEYRATTDGAFVRPDLFAAIDDGRFAARMRRRGVSLLTGECRDERFLYGTYRPAKEDSLPALLDRLDADYGPRAVDALRRFYFPEGRLPDSMEDWRSDAFGKVYSAMQIYATERGFIAGLVRGGVALGAAEEEGSRVTEKARDEDVVDSISDAEFDVVAGWGGEEFGGAVHGVSGEEEREEGAEQEQRGVEDVETEHHPNEHGDDDVDHVDAQIPLMLDENRHRIGKQSEGNPRRKGPGSSSSPGAALAPPRPHSRLFRYRIDFRSSVVHDNPTWGVFHGSDMTLWFLGMTATLPPGEKALAREALVEPLGRYLRGEDPGWGVSGRDAREMRRVTSEGTVDIWRDGRWEEGVGLWEELRRAGVAAGEGSGSGVARGGPKL